MGLRTLVGFGNGKTNGANEQVDQRLAAPHPALLLPRQLQEPWERSWAFAQHPWHFPGAAAAALTPSRALLGAQFNYLVG